MDSYDPTSALAALGQETRYTALRLLVGAGADGMSAGDLARRLDAAPSNTSFHLSALSHAGLVASEKRGQSVIYRSVPEAVNRLVSTLRSDLGAAGGG